jgi:WD40 repeat protein
VKVWCVRTGHLIYTIRGHYNVITDIAINEENTLIATASSDGYVRVWTMDGYKQVVCLRPISASVSEKEAPRETSH